MSNQPIPGTTSGQNSTLCAKPAELSESRARARLFAMLPRIRRQSSRIDHRPIDTRPDVPEAALLLIPRPRHARVAHAKPARHAALQRDLAPQLLAVRH